MAENELRPTIEITPEVEHLLRKTPEERVDISREFSKIRRQPILWTPQLAELAKATTRPTRE